MKLPFITSLSVIIFTLFVSLPGLSQQTRPPINLFRMLQNNEFSCTNRHVGVSGDTLLVDAMPGPGIVWLTPVNFRNGVIDFDVKGKDLYQKSFVGMAFHGSNDSTFEAVYFRPFNFRASDPERRKHAVQYISMPAHDWEILRTAYPDEYEHPLEPAPDPQEWLHVKILVNGPEVSVFVNGDNIACLHVKELDNKKGRKIGCWVGNNSEGAWKNISIQRHL
jgi:hypothetical protein